MQCPYCKTEIEPTATFCQKCGKPQLINLESKPEIKTYQQPARNQPLSPGTRGPPPSQEEPFEVTIIKDEETEDKIREINEKIDQRQSYGDSIGLLLLEKASLYHKIRDNSMALKNLKWALDDFKNSRDLLNMAIVHAEMGLIQEDLGFFIDSVSNFEQSINILMDLNDAPKLIQVYNNIANIYLVMNEIEKSYNYYQKAKGLAEQNNLIEEELKTSSNMVDVLFHFQHHEKIERILKRNLEYFRDIRSINGIITTLTKQGKLSFILTNYERASSDLDEAMQLINQFKGEMSIYQKARLEWELLLYKGKINLTWNNDAVAEENLSESLEALRTFEIKETLDEARVLEEIARLNETQGKHDDAIEYYILSAEIFYKFGDDFKNAELKHAIGLIHLKKLENRTEAISYFEEALEIFEELRSIKEAADLYHELGSLYANQELLEMALSHFERAKSYYEELMDEYNTNLVSEKINSLIN